MIFRWIDQKRHANIRKHGIDFEDVTEVFSKETITIVDDRYEYGERRYLTFGLLKDGSLLLLILKTTSLYKLSRQGRRRGMKKLRTSNKSKTDPKKLSSMKDADIDLSEIPEISPQMFAHGIVRRGLKPVVRKKQLTLRMDSDVIDWFRKQGQGYQTKINSLLRAYMEEHFRKSA